MNSTGAPILFSNAPCRTAVEICVVIPVKNEEAYIEATLASFYHQVDTAGKPFDPHLFEILILANNCSDNTVAVIRNFKRQHPALPLQVEEIFLPAEKANIGYVRRLLLNTACSRLTQNGGGILMTTDGDTRVAPDWIAQTVAEIEAGADAVGGRILLCEQEAGHLDRATHNHHFKDETYRLLVAELESKILQNAHNPAPTHHQHFNGSFAVTTQCYAAAGGIPPVDYLEDCAFFEQLQRIDAKVRHSNKVVVHTSARYLGRTEVGLSSQLNVWKKLALAGKEPLVEAPKVTLERLVTKRKLMDLWAHRNCDYVDLCNALKGVKSGLQITPSICESFKESSFFGTWYAGSVQPQEARRSALYPPVSIDTAIEQLQQAIPNYSPATFSQTSIR